MEMTNVLINTLQNMSTTDLENAFIGLGALIIFGIAVIVIRYLMYAIGYASMYHKAGVAPWKAFIPVYNTYNNYKLSWNGKLFFLYAVLAIVSPFLGFYTEGVMALVSMVVSIGLMFVILKQNINMAKLFGKGVGTGIALVLFPGITSLILGLGKAEYTAIAE